jgi:hypothetical protein
MTIQEITNWHFKQFAQLNGLENRAERNFHLEIAKELVRIERELENK